MLVGDFLGRPMTEAERWHHYWCRRESLTELEWLSCPYSRPMLAFIQGKTSDRKRKLFDVACCQRVWGNLDEQACRMVRAWEGAAEGLLTPEELRRAMWPGWSDPGDLAWTAAIGGDEAWQAALAREIFGDPFRPVTAGPLWLTPTVLAFASQMYESRDFSAMPILADALEDAGCDEPAILDHCRDPHGAHVRGCWVVDLVLGRG